MPSIKYLIKPLIPSRLRADLNKRLLKNVLGFDAASPSFSTCGEDLILSFLFQYKTSGFFVDVGAWHPIKSSNTYLFYLKGWRGLNIDARPGSMSAFKEVRGRDINLEVAISDKVEALTYYSLGEDENSMNSFSKDFMRYLDIEEKVSERIQIQAYPLSEILDQHLPPNQTIDFFTVDVEGMELKVLTSNNWDKYRPKVIMIESFEVFSRDFFELDTVEFLRGVNYRVIAKTPNEIVFLDNTFRLSPVGQVVPD
jgi:FkbM family methyltransferase